MYKEFYSQKMHLWQMLNRLKQHWKVKNKELVLILCTFAITGITTAWLSKKVSEWLLLEKYGIAWWLSKIIVLIFGYQVIILIVGYCLGMFPFFWKYEKKILRRFGMMKKGSIVSNQWPVEKALENNKEPSLKHVAIFASGAGSNAQKIIEYFKNSTLAKIDLVVCNKPGAGVLNIAAKENIPVLIIEKKLFTDWGYVDELKSRHIDYIILAGFLLKVPSVLINAYQGKIINIHPALLPSYGGKGMYGNAVHAAVLKAKEKQSGITIHYVDDKYDHGEIIFQKACPVNENETVESLAQKVHELEHNYYPKQIEKILGNM
jgi:formyltetrahydrofolate-dependent phosphoribosylglycinamide formyltransferase